MHYILALATSGLLGLTACNLGKTDLGELDSEGTDSTDPDPNASDPDDETGSDPGTSGGQESISGTGSGSVGDTDDDPGRSCELGSSVFGFSMQFPKEPQVRDLVRIRDASCLVESYEVESVQPMGPESIPHRIVHLSMSCDEVGGLPNQQYGLDFTTPADEDIPLSMDQQLDVHVEQYGGEALNRLAAEFRSNGQTLVRIYDSEEFTNTCSGTSDPPRAHLDAWLTFLSLRATEAECTTGGSALQLHATDADAAPILPGTVTETPAGDRKVLLEQLDCSVEDGIGIEDWRVTMIDWAI